MIKNKKQMFMAIMAFILTLLLGSTTYAFFNYTRTGANNTLLVGQIYMNHTEGTAINLNTIFPETREEARARNDNTVTIQITGLNESDEDIYYKLMLVNGDGVEGRNRIRDNLLRFDLVEILPNNEERYIIYNEGFSTINNTVLTRNRIDAGTTSNITRTYRLRMWVDESTLISDTDQNAEYTTSEFNNLFASVKIKAKGDIQNVYYYNSFSNAGSAVNSRSYASETDRSHAVAGIYIDSDDNTTNLVLYNDESLNQNCNFNYPVNINLYGYNLEYDLQDTSNGNGLTLGFYTDFTLENGTITMVDNVETHNTYSIFLANGGIGTINDIDVLTASEVVGHFISSSGSGDLTIKNSNIKSFQISSIFNSSLTMTNSSADDKVTVYSNAIMELNDSYFKWANLDSIQDNLFMFKIWDAGSKLIVNNSTIFADSPGCYDDDTNYFRSSIGISNYGTLIFNSGYVFGTHSAVETEPGSKTYVYGGTFESTNHGGFYFAQGPTGIAYVENANIRGVSYPAEGAFRPNGMVSSIEYNGVTYHIEEVKTAFYIGGETQQNNENVYLVNCNITAEGQVPFVMRYSTPRQNLYMSGCTVNSSYAYGTPFIRIDETPYMKLYLGKNNYFGNSEKFRNSNSTYFTLAEAKQNGFIVETNTNYKDIVRPE